MTIQFNRDHSARHIKAVTPEGLRFLMLPRLSPKWAVWRGPAFLLLLGLATFLLAFGVDRMVDLPQDASPEGIRHSARIMFLITSLRIGIMIPISVWLGVRVLGLNPGQLFWAGDGFRLRLFSVALAILLPLIVIVIGMVFYLRGNLGAFSPDWLTLLFAILVLMPFRFMSEDMTFRSLIPQALASTFNNGAIGAVLAIVLSAVAFSFTSFFTDSGQMMITLFLIGLLLSATVWLTAGIAVSLALNIALSLSYMFSAVLSDSFHRQTLATRLEMTEVLLIVGAVTAISLLTIIVMRRKLRY